MRWLDDRRGWVGVAENSERVIRAEIGGCEGVDELRKALEGSWARLRSDRYSLGYHMFARLEKSGCLSVTQFLESIERFEDGPWLQPVRPYLADMDSRQEQCYELGGEEHALWISEYSSFACSWNGCGVNVCDFRTQEVWRSEPLDIN